MAVSRHSFLVGLPFLDAQCFFALPWRPCSPSWKRSTCCSFSCSDWEAWRRGSGSEAVLPAYIIGMVLAGTVGKNHSSDPTPAHADLRLADALLLHSCRQSFVSVPTLIAAPMVLVGAVPRQDGLSKHAGRLVAYCLVILPATCGHDGVY